MPRSRRHRTGVGGNLAKQKSAVILFALSRRSKRALIMKKMASMNAIKRNISVGQMLIPEKNSSGSLAASPRWAMKATTRTIKGAPQTTHKVVLRNPRAKRFLAVLHQAVCAWRC